MQEEMKIFLDPLFKEFPGAHRTQQAKNICIEKALNNWKKETVCSCFHTKTF
jgi:hypothetical protein